MATRLVQYTKLQGHWESGPECFPDIATLIIPLICPMLLILLLTNESAKVLLLRINTIVTMFENDQLRYTKVQTSMDVRKLLAIHRLNLFWSGKKHLATSGEPRGHVLAPRISFKLYIDKNT